MLRSMLQSWRPAVLAAALLALAAAPPNVLAAGHGGGGHGGGGFHAGGYHAGGFYGGGYHGGYRSGYFGGYHGDYGYRHYGYGYGLGYYSPLLYGSPAYLSGGYDLTPDYYYSPNDYYSPNIYTDPYAVTTAPDYGAPAAPPQVASFNAVTPAAAVAATASSSGPATVDVRVPPGAQVWFGGDAADRRTAGVPVSAAADGHGLLVLRARPLDRRRWPRRG